MIDARDPNGLRCNAATQSLEWGAVRVRWSTSARSPEPFRHPARSGRSPATRKAASPVLGLACVKFP
jgi:hypothetical protein